MSAPAFTLQRVAVRSEGAFGVLLAHAGPEDEIGTPFAVTLERTYDVTRDGEILGQVVKVPVGRWPCTRTRFYRGGYDTYEIHVPGHTRLLFHRGNLEAHSEGCVLVGESFGVMAAQPGIEQSGAGLAEFLSRAGSRPEFELEVRV